MVSINGLTHTIAAETTQLGVSSDNRDGGIGKASAMMRGGNGE